MKKTKYKKGKWLLIIALALIFFQMAAQAEFHYRITTVNKNSQGQDINQIEQGSNLFQVKTQMESTLANQWISSFQADIGYENNPGFPTNALSVGSVTDLFGGAWTGAGKLLAVSAGDSDSIDYQKSVGMGVVEGGGGVTIANADAFRDIYQINFNVLANAPAGAYSLKFRPLGVGALNQVKVNRQASSLTQSPDYAFTIVAGAAPSLPVAPTAVSPDTGNKINVSWTALSNVIGVADLTPPIKYDLQRSTSVDFSQNLVNILQDHIPSNALDFAGGARQYSDTNSVSDGQDYYYRIRAKDSTTNSNATAWVAMANPVVSRDTSPPTFPNGAAVTLTPGNNSIAVAWNAASSPDNEPPGYILIRKEGSAPDNTAPGRGELYAEGAPFGDAVVIYVGEEQNFTDNNVANGGSYFYKVFAFDRAGIIGGVRHQGWNYSAPISSGNPPLIGSAPDPVTKSRAFAGPNPGEITLKWINPALNNYGGAVVIYATDINRWDQIAKNSDGGDFTRIDVPREGDGQETIKVIQNLNPQNAYYFKVFPYNRVAGNDPARRLIQDNGAMTAAIPAAAVQAGGQQPAGPTEASFGPFVKVDGKLGIFNIVLPFEPVENGAVLKISDLVNKINGNAKVVTSISYWDTSNQKVVAYIYDKDGTLVMKKGTDAAPQNVNVAAFMGYQVQISATSNAQFTLRSR